MKYTECRKTVTISTEQVCVTDHVNMECHVINWDEATIIVRESDRTAQWIREAVKIRQQSQDVINRDEGTAYQLSHVYDNLLLPTVTSRGPRRSQFDKGSSRCQVIEYCELFCVFLAIHNQMFFVFKLRVTAAMLTKICNELSHLTTD